MESILAGRPEIQLLPALQGRLGLDLAREHRPDLVKPLDVNQFLAAVDTVLLDPVTPLT